MRHSRLSYLAGKLNIETSQNLERNQSRQTSQGDYGPLHQGQAVYPSGEMLGKSIPGETDSCASITFDSGYSSGDILSANLSTEISIDDRTYSSSNIKHNTSEDLFTRFDSGLGTDSHTSLTSEVNIQCFTEKETETNVADKTPLYDWRYIYRQDEDGDTLLHLTVVEKSTDIVFPLIQLAPHPYFLDIFNSLFQTSLHLAALSGRSNIARRLVIAGATLNLQDRHGNTALHIASQQGDVDCVKALITPLNRVELQEAACPYEVFVKNIDLSDDLLNAKNYNGQTSLHLTTLGGYQNVVECLVYHGANVDAQDGKNGKTALHYAVERLDVELVHFLLALCYAKVSVSNFAYQTPLHLALIMQKKNPKSARLRTIIDLLKQYSTDEIEPYISTETSSSSEEEVSLRDIPHTSNNSRLVSY